MFITSKRSGYNRQGEQVASGLFLIMTQPKECPEFPTISAQCNAPIRCFVRFASLSQCGHFMMGQCRLHGKSIILSGAYGHDGLPLSLDVENYKRGIELPLELREAWNKGGGWNSAGGEASKIRQWALQNLKALRSA